MSRLQAAVFQVLEGFTLSDDVRKILEAAYYADDTFTQGRAAGLEEAAKIAESTYIKDPFRFELGTEAARAIRSISPTSSDAGKVRAYAIYRTNPEENEGKEFFYYAMWHNDTIPGDGERVVPGYFTPDAALSSLEVIGKGEKG